MSGHPWSQVPTRILLTGVVCLGAAGCGSSTTPTVTSIGPPTTAADPTTSVPPTMATKATTAATAATAPPMTIRIGPGTQVRYSVEVQPAAGSCHYRTERGTWLPDPSCTPGAVNPQVTQATIATTICLSGWTSTVRPPASVTGPEKLGSALAYGFTGSFRTGEYDHLIPLELGGDPNDPANLWLQPNENPTATSTRNTKDSLENTLKGLVCSGRLTLAVSQQTIAADWLAAARRFTS
jgi:hypothetical protein